MLFVRAGASARLSDNRCGREIPMSMAERNLEQVHVALPALVDRLNEGKLERREFLRMSTLLGLSATAAYALAGIAAPVAPAEAATGGTVTFSMRVALLRQHRPPGLRLPHAHHRGQRHPSLAAREVEAER
jgi:hypothetical protein